MRILNLIISSDDAPFYGVLRDEWRRYMNRHPCVRSYFVMNDRSKCGGGPDTVMHQDGVYFDANETGLPGIYEKTVRALMLFRSEEYDYVIRTNLSSFYRWDRLVAYLQTHDIPRHGFMGGAINWTPEPCYVSGCGMIMSRDVCDLLIQNYHHRLKCFLADDQVIGIVCHENGVRMTDMPRLDLREDDWRDDAEAFIDGIVRHRLDDETFHIRTRCGTDAFRQEYGTQMYRRLVDHFYYYMPNASQL